MDRDRSCLSYWFPKLQSVPGVQVPETRIVRTELQLLHLLDGKVEPEFLSFADALRAVAEQVGYPCFLRTGQGSGKHEWNRCCFVPGPDAMEGNVANLVNWSECVDFLGLPTSVWAVRKFLPLRIDFTLPAYGNMPLAREFRFFIEKGQVCCRHPYWPEGAVEQGRPEDPDWRTKLLDFNLLQPDEVHLLEKAAVEVSRAFGPTAWSLDFAQHQDGSWCAIDMAPAEMSFHWDGCPVPQLKGWVHG